MNGFDRIDDPMDDPAVRAVIRKISIQRMRQPKWLTTKQISTMTGLSMVRVRSFIKSGDLPAHTIDYGNCRGHYASRTIAYRVFKSDFDEWVKRRFKPVVPKSDPDKTNTD